MKKKIISWIFFLVWLILIFFFSNQDGQESSEISNHFLNLLANCLPNVPQDILSFIIRKFAHFMEYLVLGVLLLNLLKQYGELERKYIVFSILFCIFYAFTDEYHQEFLDGRVGSLWDVMIDICGSLFGIVFYILTT